MERKQEGERVFIYDTTLRDGTQQRGISLSVDDKVKILRLLDGFGVPYVEGGWPGSNPKDCEFFERARSVPLRAAKLVAFGATRRAGCKVEDDANLAALLASGTPAAALVGKSSLLHVERVLGVSPEENLAMIGESVRYLKDRGLEVIYDAEHFFDGFKLAPGYALETLQAAQSAGADWIVLCDTNGGSLPEEVARIVRQVKGEIPAPLGIHAHNDCETAVANSILAVEAGCRQIQGTINGYGERCGNANLISLIASLQIKLGLACVQPEKLAGLTALSRAVSEIVNFPHPAQAAYVGSSAFAHKGGLHVAAVEKVKESYEHVDPAVVGNSRAAVVSELSGRGNVRVLAKSLGLAVDGSEKEVLDRIKNLELDGYQFEDAEGSVELLMRRSGSGYRPPFQIADAMVVSERRHGESMKVQAVLKVAVGQEVVHTAAEGDGPVHALDCALRKSLCGHYPELEQVRLVDYKVRILDPGQATSAKTRVFIEAASGEQSWSTIGCSTNILEASFQALADSYELVLLRSGAPDLN